MAIVISIIIHTEKRYKHFLNLLVEKQMIYNCLQVMLGETF